MLFGPSDGSTPGGRGGLQGGGGGGGTLALPLNPLPPSAVPIGLSCPPSPSAWPTLTPLHPLPFRRETVPTQPPDCPCATAPCRAHAEEGTGPRRASQRTHTPHRRWAVWARGKGRAVRRAARGCTVPPCAAPGAVPSPGLTAGSHTAGTGYHTGTQIFVQHTPPQIKCIPPQKNYSPPGLSARRAAQTPPPGGGSCDGSPRGRERGGELGGQGPPTYVPRDDRHDVALYLGVYICFFFGGGLPKMAQPDCPNGKSRDAPLSPGGGGGTRPWWLALLACGGAYWPLALEPSAMTGGGGSRGGWGASSYGCQPFQYIVGDATPTTHWSSKVKVPEGVGFGTRPEGRGGGGARVSRGSIPQLRIATPPSPTSTPPPRGHTRRNPQHVAPGRAPGRTRPTARLQGLPPPPPPCDIPSGCCSFMGPWTVPRSSLRMLRQVAAFCRLLRPVLRLVSFPRSRSPVVGVLGLCWMWRDAPFGR